MARISINETQLCGYFFLSIGRRGYLAVRRRFADWSLLVLDRGIYRATRWDNEKSGWIAGRKRVERRIKLAYKLNSVVVGANVGANVGECRRTSAITLSQPEGRLPYRDSWLVSFLFRHGGPLLLIDGPRISIRVRKSDTTRRCNDRAWNSL